AAALVSSAEAAQAQQIALFGIGQQVVGSQPRVYVRKHRVAHRHSHHASTKRASTKTDSNLASLDSKPQQPASADRVAANESTAVNGSTDTKRHAAHERKHKGKSRPRRLASSGKGAVRTTSCPGLARFLSAMPKTAKGPQIDPVDPKRRIAEAFQGVASDASDSVSINDATEPTCSGVTASFYSDPQKTANGE